MTCYLVRGVLPGLLVLLLPAFASAQLPERPYYGPYSVYGPGLTYAPRSDYTALAAVVLFATAIERLLSH